MSLDCRFCKTPLTTSFVDLGMSPLSNAYLAPQDLQRMEAFFPLHAYVCPQCFLVQLAQFESPENIFSHYAYFSSYSETWLNHAQRYTEMICEKLKLNETSLVIEIASNDGYLLQYFKARQIPILGIEPAQNIAAVAREKGIPTLNRFFGTQTAQELQQDSPADLIVGNNVLAHVPDLNDFIAGLKLILKPAGVITLEFPHLLQLMQLNQFDTIYHEHFSYFSLLTVQKIFAAHQLSIFEVETLPTHGGSLRIYVQHAQASERPYSEQIDRVLSLEKAYGLDQLATYTGFAEQVVQVKCQLLNFLIQARQSGQSVVGYGAPAKGNTLLNYCGIGPELIAYTVDRNPNKQGHYLPGTHLPICSPEQIRATRPDYLVILPWNLKEEIMAQMAFIREWQGKFVVPIPKLEIYP
ncbi:SAM-dependent methyltransferase [bacterium (Candidatus Blackallbacteria) CG17_big_fil_post_rev_8_21_14_2_50_48_46]|uniref:SAM-dependent methyltransferase n=1 Tax=bacterium (Candidatus Blackallbacteria) CG17_big_fil_post_rev_8_21_14_2_50_48_46 TaxID=2014261 RepID=A0A2M7GA97_9BACT|nr:MAG: SAM-dependent methyltransferase [bacterium (Candidatus Blackallbacteria) CG18_big_fil_WC_8_21_14_2_50_49_26]PIW19072.1 MAG: SAM-dependent methyltransferase [bacterium (Candidatus Blackallbacteria) CG17_big_fil_post_rev_8_21_14_2_50_48_46]PIW44561.1 MAG: SAM-dependent methyltransferase [bacterium (Candidatus Blackallbacteria) CG13_big_fil_rev_8_21_14_2_50_49_14]